ncbi:killer suppression protein HigA [Serratia grimesii]|uniref:killer suppression protein HigA n=1 Tax=Serratia grimesii TaxID=82995 RepID=UPI0021C77236|nr:killer suppression protein HigA [Serratia grimesii]
MYITFQSKKLRAICENMHNANEILGEKLASKLRSRLSDIAVVENLLLLPVGSPKVGFEDGEECITITLLSDMKLGFVCGHTIQPKNQDNTINWSQVSRIRLVFIGDVK